MNTIQYKFLLQRAATLLSVAILTLALVAALSGLLVGFNYQPAAGKAYDSVQWIATQLTSGRLILGLHQWAGNGLIIAGLVQIPILFLGRQARRSWFTAWVSGFALTACAIALGWTAMILPWDQLGFWRLRVELSTLGSLPILGTLINQVLLGGGGMDTRALVHFYAIHSYILSLVAIGLALTHLIALVVHEQQERDAVLQQLERLVDDAEVATEAATQAESGSEVDPVTSQG
ncbi:cytochrome b N-terminal domain-containing protein [Lyngbya confervoides]|uniref:Cytochrome b N-terminal domain-containing protein n=1 Tax=Lyngbya confervoides BDU141951 TaxID=1574623 RepID=A0ABD4T0W0_9CYAN|nr:cytochrome b N-terminal domain-containing protein [Lyngbya confervoides]MCM1982065.1 cytochrome b N-terminal domain-containing protein [Lyngbya confervoides BDU141951]